MRETLLSASISLNVWREFVERVQIFPFGFDCRSSRDGQPPRPILFAELSAAGEQIVVHCFWPESASLPTKREPADRGAN